MTLETHDLIESTISPIFKTLFHNDLRQKCYMSKQNLIIFNDYKNFQQKYIVILMHIIHEYK